MTSSYVQLPTDGTGKDVATRVTTTYDASGNVLSVHQQVVTLADSQGFPLDWDMDDTNGEMLVILKQIRRALLLLLNVEDNQQGHYDLADLSDDATQEDEGI